MTEWFGFVHPGGSAGTVFTCAEFCPPPGKEWRISYLWNSIEAGLRVFGRLVPLRSMSRNSKLFQTTSNAKIR